MPLATSDFRNPVCQELRSLRSASGIDRIGSIFAIETKTSPLQAPDVSSSTFGKVYNEQGSVDSSDTYASCQTHPSHSQGDLTEEADSNLYINPLEAADKCAGGGGGGGGGVGSNNVTTTGVGSGSVGSVTSVGIGVGRVKKSVSGEVGRNVNDVSPSVESLKDIRPFNEPSKVALNDSIPKHRKIRIQQSGRPRAQFICDQDNTSTRITVKEMENNNNHYGGLRGGRPFAFGPTNSLASATRIINQHFFGSISGPRHYNTGTNTESKLSLSADSIDSEGVPFIEKHRVAKSILKKSESSNNYYNNVGDSDTEKLITDNTSMGSMCDNETHPKQQQQQQQQQLQPQPQQQPVSPLLSRQVLESIFRTNNNAERDFSGDQTDGKNCVAKIPRLLFDDVLEEEKHARDETVAENKNKESEEHKQRTKVHTEEASKDSQTMLICSLRPYKVVRKSDEKRKPVSNKSSTTSSSHTYKSSDTNCLPQEYRFSSS